MNYVNSYIRKGNESILRQIGRYAKKWLLRTALALYFATGITVAVQHYLPIFQTIETEAYLGPLDSTDRLDRKITELKQDILNQLADCETGGVKEPAGYVRMDSNEYTSWTKYQWQRKSIIYYAKKLYGKEIGLREAGLIAFDSYPEVPLDELTLRVLFEDEKGAKNWFTCSKKLGLQNQIDIIKKLEL